MRTEERVPESELRDGPLAQEAELAVARLANDDGRVSEDLLQDECVERVIERRRRRKDERRGRLGREDVAQRVRGGLLVQVGRR